MSRNKKKNSEKQKLAYATGVKDAKLIYANKSPEAKERMKWNKGKTKLTDERVKAGGEKTHAKYLSGELINPFKGKKHSEKTKQQIGKVISSKYNKNIDRHGGRGKKGWYKGYFCSSTYELAYIIYCLDHSIKIERNTKGYEYKYKGKVHKYFPDFIVNEEYVEIKGYHTELVDIKIKAVKDKPINVLYYDDLKNVFEYIQEKYGKTVDKNISDLYEIKT